MGGMRTRTAGGVAVPYHGEEGVGVYPRKGGRGGDLVRGRGARGAKEAARGP